jgi:uncharacterized protein YrrD
MLRNLKELENYVVVATDGEVGHVRDFFLDDEVWGVRYFVVETGPWLASRKVLISPIAIRQPNWLKKTIEVSITIAQVEGSPEVDTEKPVSRQHEMRHLGYYDYPQYWGSTGLWGNHQYSDQLISQNNELPAKQRNIMAKERAAYLLEVERHDEDPHLRSCDTIIGYKIQATDGGIGRVQGFLVDTDTWAIRYFVVETGNWWDGHQVLITPHLIGNICWSDSTASVNLTRKAVKAAPIYDPAALLNNEQEMSIYEQ